MNDFEPQLVIGITNGAAECLSNKTEVDYLILNFDVLDEHGDSYEEDRVEKLLEEERFSEVLVLLTDIEERVDREISENFSERQDS